jgi:PKD repeat protein
MATYTPGGSTNNLVDATYCPFANAGIVPANDDFFVIIKGSWSTAAEVGSIGIVTGAPSLGTVGYVYQFKEGEVIDAPWNLSPTVTMNGQIATQNTQFPDQGSTAGHNVLLYFTGGLPSNATGVFLQKDSGTDPNSTWWSELTIVKDGDSYGTINSVTLTDLTNLLSPSTTVLIDAPAGTNNKPISYFYVDNSEGYRFQITDLSFDFDGLSDIKEWKFTFTKNAQSTGDGSGGYYGSTQSADFTQPPISTGVTYTADNGSGATLTFTSPPPPTFYYKFDNAGDKEISLKVTDLSGNNTTSTLEAPGFLFAGNIPPEAGFRQVVDRFSNKVDFTDESSDQDGSIASYSWDFGDNSGTSTSRNPTYTYAAAGTYDVTLTVTDDSGASNNTATVTLTNMVVPRQKTNILFVDDGPIACGFSTVSGLSARTPVQEEGDVGYYRGHCWLPFYRIIDLYSEEPDETLTFAQNRANSPLTNDIYQSAFGWYSTYTDTSDGANVKVLPLSGGYTRGPTILSKNDTHNGPGRGGLYSGPLSIKDVTIDAHDNYDVLYEPDKQLGGKPTDGSYDVPYGMSEWYKAEVPIPVQRTPEPANQFLRNGLYSVIFDSETYFRIYIDTSGSMNSYVSTYRAAANVLATDIANQFFNGDTAKASKYILPSVNISNERWGSWANTNLVPSGEPKKQVVICACNEDNSGGQGSSNNTVFNRAMDFWSSGGHYYAIIVRPPGGSNSNLWSSGPALANSTQGSRKITGVNGAGVTYSPTAKKIHTDTGDYVRWAQYSNESARGNAFYDVMRRIVGLTP